MPVAIASSVSPATAAQAPFQLPRPAVVCERLQRMDREAPRVGRERREWRPAARVRNPWPGLDAGRDRGDGPVGDAQEDEVAAVGVDLDTALAQSRTHRAPDAPTRSHDNHCVNQSVLQFPSDTGLFAECNAEWCRLLPALGLPDAMAQAEAGAETDEPGGGGGRTAQGTCA